MTVPADQGFSAESALLMSSSVEAPTVLLCLSDGEGFHLIVRLGEI